MFLSKVEHLPSDGRIVRCKTHPVNTHSSVKCDKVHIAEKDVPEFVAWACLSVLDIDFSSFGPTVNKTIRDEATKYFPNKALPLGACWHGDGCTNDACKYLHGTRDQIVTKLAIAALFHLPVEASPADRELIRTRAALMRDYQNKDHVFPVEDMLYGRISFTDALPPPVLEDECTLPTIEPGELEEEGWTAR